MHLYLVRHGRQSSTLCNVDVGLSEAGRRQAELTGRRLQDSGITALASSSMVRAQQTADLMNASLDLPRLVDPRLRELNFGDMEGLTDAEIGQRFADFHAAQAEMREDLPYPGGEAPGAVAARALAAIDDLAALGHERVAIVTHGVVIRTLAAHALGAPIPRWRSVAVRLENGSITELTRNNSGSPTRTFTLERLNDYAHLEPYPELLRAAWGVAEN
ncbi:MAG: histidine phosphatase family protein [Dermabacter sp.]|nr:histidine phosphatase family protein [Dermabacter sp.]